MIPTPVACGQGCFHLPMQTTPEQLELLRSMEKSQRENADWFVTHKKNHFTAGDYRAKADALAAALADLSQFHAIFKELET